MSDDQVPHVSAWLQSGFHRFIRPLLRRHFHAIAIDRESFEALSIPDDQPIIVYGNHPSWWDPLVSHLLNQKLFHPRQFYAPIDAIALEKYQVFAKLGFYGIEMHSLSGATRFLKQSRAILALPNTAIWLTPEGRFADARDRSGTLMPGLSHLCSHMQIGVVIPFALEYVFWDERLPVCLAKFGPAINAADEAATTKQAWAVELNRRLRETQDQLANLAMNRSSEPFENLMTGRVGGGVMYDSLRRAKSFVTGKPFDASHGKQFK